MAKNKGNGEGMNEENGMTDNIESVKPYVSIQWVCNKCFNINTESFYNYRTHEFFECRKCEEVHRLCDIN